MSQDPLEFVFAVKTAEGSTAYFTVDFVENGYARIKTTDATGKEGGCLVQWINGHWHRHKLSNDDGVVDTCPVHADGQHRHDTDALTSKEMLFSTNLRVQASVLPPKKCACGQIKLPGVDY